MGKFETIISFVFQICFILMGLLFQHQLGPEHSKFGFFVAVFFILFGSVVSFYYNKDVKEKYDAIKQNSEEKLCPCGHEHKPRSDGRGLRTYCVEGSNCNSDKCKEFVSLGKGDEE